MSDIHSIFVLIVTFLHSGLIGFSGLRCLNMDNGVRINYYSFLFPRIRSTLVHICYHIWAKHNFPISYASLNSIRNHDNINKVRGHIAYHVLIEWILQRAYKQDYHLLITQWGFHLGSHFSPSLSIFYERLYLTLSYTLQLHSISRNIVVVFILFQECISQILPWTNASWF